MELLASGHAWNATDSGYPRLSPYPIKCAKDFTHANNAQPLRLLDIANAAGLPERTLTEGFQKFCGMSPMQYFRQARLDRARDALRSAPLNARVSDIAHDCGFVRLGRFSIEYRKRFGESPSETLGHR